MDKHSALNGQEKCKNLQLFGWLFFSQCFLKDSNKKYVPNTFVFRNIEGLLIDQSTLVSAAKLIS